MPIDHSRRQFGQMAIAAPLALSAPWSARAQSRPNSRIRGVQVGVITGSFNDMTAGQMIPAMTRIGLSEVELQSNHAEALAGAPVAVRPPAPAQPRTLNAQGLAPRCESMQMVTPLVTTSDAAPRPLTPAQETMWAWRNQTTPETWHGVRRQFDAAGIEIRMLWYGLGYFMPPYPTDEEIDYAFRMAKGLGVRGVSGSSLLTFAPQIAKTANKYGLTYAGHTQDNIHNPDQFATPEAYEKLLAISPDLRICLDIGYFTAAGFDAVPFIRKHHARISDIHLKDRKRSKSFGGDVTSNLLNNFPFGQGDAPIREVLQLLRDQKWDIPVQIEYDYGCRTASDSETEVARSLAYCRSCLEA